MFKYITLTLMLFTLNHYTLNGVVVNETPNIVTIKDNDGYLWDIFQPSRLQLGEKVTMLMDTNNTKSIFDDVIVKIKEV